MVRINRDIDIPERELSFSWTTSRGPGGQNVNKVETCAVLHFDLDASEALEEKQKEAIRRRLSGRINRNGVLYISSQSHRTREANRRSALERFVRLLREALRPAKKRKRTSAPRKVAETRLREKKHRGKVKRLRQRPDPSKDI